MGKRKDFKECSDGARKRGSDQLGIHLGAARSRLIKIIMFKQAQDLNKDICYRCGKKILSIDEFSIDHKKEWLYSDNSNDLYFDYENIAFSHLSCNISSRRKSLRLPNRVSKTGFRGVSKRGTCNRYRACIKMNNKSYSIGDFATPEEAAECYDKKAIELFGSNAITNKSMGLI